MKINVDFNDFFQVETQRNTTDEGYVVVPGVLARTGIQDYYAYEMGLKDRKPMEKIRVYRPADEVFHKDSLASFEHKPITIGHPPGGVNSKNWEKLAKGEAKGIVQDGSYMRGTLIIKASDAIEKMNSGKVQLSNGYSSEIDFTPGVTEDGQQYDAVQRNIRGNHIAIVDNARCGSACRIADEEPPTNQGVKKMKVTIKGVSLEIADDTQGALIQQLVEDHAAAVAQVGQLQTALNTTAKFGTVDIKVSDTAALQKVLSDAHAEIETLKKDVITPERLDAIVLDRGLTIDNATKMHPKIVTKDKTCHQIRKDAIVHITAADSVAKSVAKAIIGDTEIDKVDEKTVRTVFDAVASLSSDSKSTTNKAHDKAFSDAIVNQGDSKTTEKPLVGRAKWLADQQKKNQAA